MDPYIGEIRIFAGTYAPDGWLLCDGTTYPVNQFQALFSVISNIYGGDGRTTFKVPDLRNRAAMGAGSGAGLTPRQLANTVGTTQETLTTAQIPAHIHIPQGSSVTTGGADPTNAVWGTKSALTKPYSSTVNSTMNANILSSTGGGAPHNNMQPYLPINYIIAWNGVYPAKD